MRRAALRDLYVTVLLCPAIVYPAARSQNKKIQNVQ